MEKTEKDKKQKRSFWERLWKKNKLKQPKKVAVLYLRKNGNAEPMEVESRDGFFNINNRVYHENRDCMFSLGRERYPLAIIPEGSVTPIGRKEWEDKEMQEKFATLQDHVMKGIRHAERVRMGEKEGKPLNIKAIIVIAIVALVAGAIFVGYR